jgi:long-chain acyl-CoA synthetase
MPGKGWRCSALEAAALGRDDVACIIYTSGTGGQPKGVMQSHRSILHNCAGAHDLLVELGLGDDVFLSLLPLSHAYEHTAGLHFPISLGAEIHFCEGPDMVAQNLAEVRPTIMVAVPRLYEVLHERIRRGVERAGGLRAKLFERAVTLGRKRYLGTAGPLEALENLVLDRLVRAKVAGRFGGRLKTFVSGGGPLNPEIGTFFLALGVNILQGYGQTEAAPVVSCNRPGQIRIHTVGPLLKDTEVRIAEDGEILVRGDLLMTGYWREPEVTAETLRDGWLHTGDIGHFDDQGCLLITDRKKDIIVNSGGDNVAPARVEGYLTLEPEIAQAMVHGDRRPYLVGLIVPAADFVEAWAKENGKPGDLAALAEDAAFRQAVGAVVDRVNGRLSQLEKVRRFHIAQAPFTTDNAMMTPTLKVRRHKVREVYGEKLDALYASR